MPCCCEPLLSTPNRLQLARIVAVRFTRRAIVSAGRASSADEMHGASLATARAPVSAFLGPANVTTTARYLYVKDDYLQELIERKPLMLVR
jgi:hypothetical protein